MPVGSSSLDMIRAWVDRFVRWRPSPRIRRLIFVAAAVVFLVASTAAVSHLPPVELRVSPLLIAAALAVFIPVLNAAEYLLAGRWLGIRVGYFEAISVTVVASAANLAPVPGAALVRGRALLRRGGQGSGTARVLGAIGIAWVAVALAVAGVAVALSGNKGAAVILTLAGASGVGLLWILIPSRSLLHIVQCLLVELVAVVLQAIRLALILTGFGFGGHIGQTLALPAAGALGNAAGVVPGGLGISEVIAGGIAPLVGMPLTHGVTATAADRILSLAILAIAAAAVLATSRISETE